MKKIAIIMMVMVTLLLCGCSSKTETHDVVPPTIEAGKEKQEVEKKINEYGFGYAILANQPTIVTENDKLCPVLQAQYNGKTYTDVELAQLFDCAGLYIRNYGKALYALSWDGPELKYIGEVVGWYSESYAKDENIGI